MSPWQVIEEALARKRPVRGPKWLADALGESIQTVTNWKTRGVPARRYRDVASALGLTVDQIEGLSPLPWARAADAEWPFSSELHQKVLTLSDEELYRLEKVMRAHLDMPQEIAGAVTEVTQLDTAHQLRRQYSRGPEEGAGLPEDMQVPAPQRHAQRSTDRGRPRQKGGGGS